MSRRVPAGERSSSLLSAFHAWHPAIQFEVSSEGVVNFLDLKLWASESLLTYDLFRKPRNLYLYLPFGSNHPPSVFRSLITGEAKRIQRRCKDAKRVQHHLAFFRERLVERGYSRSFISRVLDVKHVKRPSIRPSFFKVRFQKQLDVPFIRSCLRKSGLNIKVCFKVHPNLFRRRYASSWLRVGGFRGQDFLTRQ